jgi:hypothetical protein
MQEELEDKDIEVDDLRSRMVKQKELADLEIDELKRTIAAQLKQKPVFDEAPIRRQGSSRYDQQDDRGSSRGGEMQGSRRASTNSPMLSRQGSTRDTRDAGSDADEMGSLGSRGTGGKRDRRSSSKR